jgi:hypothetical protein
VEYTALQTLSRGNKGRVGGFDLTTAELHNLFEVEDNLRVLPRVARKRATLGFVAESLWDSFIFSWRRFRGR